MVFDELLHKGFHFAQDEGGGGGVADDAGGTDSGEGGEAGGETQDEVFEVGGEQLSRDEVIKRAENHGKLQGEYTQTRQEMAELKGRLDEVSRRQTTPQETQAKEEEPDFEGRLDDLMADPYADDFKKNMAALRREEREWQQQQSERGIADIENRVTQRLTATERATEIDRHNRDVFDAVLADKERVPINITKEEKDALWADFEKHIGEGYGEYDAGARRFRRNEEAVETALFAVKSVKEKLLAHRDAQTRDEGLRGRAKGEGATRSAPTTTARPSGRPHEEAFDETVDWLREQTPAARSRFYRENPQFVDRYEKEESRRRREYLDDNPS
jgi:hypothetical protein